MTTVGGKLVACGYLRKKSPKGLVVLSLWQRRFFCLYESVMTYSKDKTDVGHNKVSGAVPVREMVSVERVPKDSCRFDIIISGRVFSLLADSPEEVTDWVDAIAKQIALSRMGLHQSNSDSDHDKPVKYWKDAKGVLDDLNSPDRPSAPAFNFSNAFTKIDLSTLPSLSSITMRSVKSGVKINVVPPSSDEIDAATLQSSESTDSIVIGADNQTASERRFDLDTLKVERILGQGAFGELCLVVDSESAQRYMMQRVKVATLATAPMALDAMRRMSSLNNPYIMQCMDYEIGAEQAWAIYEYVQGPNLLQHLRSQRRLSEDVVRYLLAEIVFAVNYLHKKGSTFRNMDPEHIALDHTGHVVITDLRIALAAADNVDLPCRNAEYRTPDFITGGLETPESDWWRLGVLAYELLVGFPPFRDKDPAELDHKIQSCVLRFPPFVSGPAAVFLERLMQTDSQCRLGRDRTGFYSIQAHTFFAETKWDLVESRSQVVPDPILLFVQTSKKTK